MMMVLMDSNERESYGGTEFQLDGGVLEPRNTTQLVCVRDDNKHEKRLI